VIVISDVIDKEEYSCEAIGGRERRGDNAL